MANQITAGGVAAIFAGKTDSKPVVQVMDIKKLSASGAAPAADRYRLVISDGAHYMQAMLATQLNRLVTNNEIQLRCLVRLDEFICNLVHDRQIAIVLNVSVVAPPLPQIVGAPVSMDKAPAGGASAPAAAPVAPPPAYQNPAVAAPPPQQPHSAQYGAIPAQPARAPAAASYQQPPRTGQASTMPGDASVFPISALNPYQSQRWMIKARVTHKGEVKHWKNDRGEGKLMNMELLDKDGGKMRAVVFGEGVDMFEPLIQQGKTYFISRGQIKPTNKKFNPNGGDYEMTLDKNSTITPTDDDEIPVQAFNFVSIVDIQNISADKVVDVIGKVVHVGDLTQINTKRGTQLSKRNVTLVDSSNASIELTLWGKHAETFNTDGIVAIQGAKVSEWGARTLSSQMTSVIDINPDLPIAHKLRAWYDANQHNLGNVTQLTQAGVRPTGDGGAGGAGGNFKPTAYKTFKQVRDENMGRNGSDPDFYLVTATVSSIKHEKDVWYNACPNCKKKVTEASGAGGWMCEKCSQTFPDCDRRYIIRATMCDHTGSEWLNAFNEQGEALLGGVPAKQLHQWKETGDEQYEAVFDNSLFKEFVFKVRAKTDTWQDNVRVQHTVVSATPVDFGGQITRLKELIGRYHAMGYQPSL